MSNHSSIVSQSDNRCQTLYLDLLKRSLTNVIYGDSNMSPGAATSDYVPELRESGRDWPSIAHTMVGLKRLDNLQRCIEQTIFDQTPGDLIETGVWRGGASILMRGVLEAYGERGRKVWVADSFEGLPKPDPDRYPADAGDEHHAYAELAVSLEEVEENFRRYGLLDDQVRFVKGWFRDTLPVLPVQQFAIIRLDGDMYESTIVALEALYPKLVDRGFVIIDDYGAIDGCRRAVDDFRDANAIAVPMHDVDWTGVYWQKSTTPCNDSPAVEVPASGTIDEIQFFDAAPLDGVSEAVTIPSGLSGMVRGWAADRLRERLVARVLLQVDDMRPTRAEYGLERPDVAIALGNEVYAHSGFRGEFSTAGLMPGVHSIRAIAVALDGTRLPLLVQAYTFIVGGH